jgi:hypothetical protein
MKRLQTSAILIGCLLLMGSVCAFGQGYSVAVEDFTVKTSGGSCYQGGGSSCFIHTDNIGEVNWSVEYDLVGSPTITSIVILGNMPGGTSNTLNTYSTSSNTIIFGGGVPYSSYTITPTWSACGSPPCSVVFHWRGYANSSPNGGTVTQSGTWNVRTQDGAGNALTSNSSTYTSKFALDVNLLGVAGSLFSATNPLFTRPTDGTTAISNCVSAYGTAPTGTECEGVNAIITSSLVAFNVTPTPNAASAFATLVSSQSALTTAVVVKASAGNVYGAFVVNASASTCYLEFMNASSAPTLGTAAIFSIPIPGSGTNGGVINIPSGAMAMANFSTGISVGLATAYNGASACGSAGTATVFYK